MLCKVYWNLQQIYVNHQLVKRSLLHEVSQKYTQCLSYITKKEKKNSTINFHSTSCLHSDCANDRDNPVSRVRKEETRFPLALHNMRVRQITWERVRQANALRVSPASQRRYSNPYLPIVSDLANHYEIPDIICKIGNMKISNYAKLIISFTNAS